MQYERCEVVPGCAIPVDIILQSSNGERFGSHTKNLEAFSDSFPPSKWVTCTITEPLELSEAGSTLRLLLAFMHNAVAPDISKLDINTLLELYTASEKYGCFIALHACRESIKHLVVGKPAIALAVLRYKLLRSDYTDIDDIARQTLDLPLKDVVPAFEGLAEQYLLWSKYLIAHEAWLTKYKSCVNAGIFLSNCHYMQTAVPQIRQVATKISKYPSVDELSKAIEAVDLVFGAKRCCDPNSDKCLPAAPWLQKLLHVFEDQPRWVDIL